MTTTCIEILRDYGFNAVAVSAHCIEVDADRKTIVNVLIYGNGLDVAVCGTGEGCEVWTDYKALESDRQAKANKAADFNSFLETRAKAALDAAKPSNFWSAWATVKAAAEHYGADFSTHTRETERFCLCYLYQ